MRKIALISVMTLCLVMLTAGVALAAHTDKGDRTGWDEKSALGCTGCHGAAVDKHTYGPHGGYTSSTNNCQTCHKVHKAASAQSLLPGATVTAACNFCHDLTGTNVAPYFASDIPSTDIKSQHGVAGIVYFDSGNYSTNIIPGGSAADGGDATLDTSAQGDLSGNVFTCNSCHTPHALSGQTVDPYLGESHVKETSYGLTDGIDRKIFLTNRILKKTVNGVDTGSSYGSAWCIGCHQGRDNSDHGGTFNHPVNASGKGYDLLGAGMQNGVSFVNGFNAGTITNSILIGKDGDEATAQLNGDPRSNKWYSMILNDPLNTDAEHPNGVERPDGNMDYDAAKLAGGPSCQQCHASPRNVEESFWGATFSEDGAGYPSRGTFPHLSTNEALLSESGDDFCTNCHGTTNLP